MSPVTYWERRRREVLADRPIHPESIYAWQVALNEIDLIILKCKRDTLEELQRVQREYGVA